MPKIFISRDLRKNSPFLKLLKEQGMEVIGQSLIQFSPISFDEIPAADWFFFYSKNGVRYFWEGLVNLNMPNFENLAYFRQQKWAVIGEGTAKALRQKGIEPHFIGTGHPHQTARTFQKIANGQKVLFIRAKNSKQSVQKLLSNDIIIKDLVVYRNTIKVDFQIPNCDYLVFTSPLNATAYFQKYGLQAHQKVIAIGKTTTTKLEALGIKNYITTAKPNETYLAKSVLELHQKQPKINQSMTDRFAVIDLGTNTFHLLVAEKVGEQSFKELFRQRFFVKLAEEGIETIGVAPLQRGMEALKNFRATLDKLKVETVKAIGTAALRTASNGAEFIGQVKENYNITIELIDGNREAELIYKGVRLAVPFEANNYLIMDIGGGSVEFIIANQAVILWRQSFPIGVAVLYKKFHHSEPINKTEIVALNNYLESFLGPLYQALKEFPTQTLVGASGTFDVLEYILAKEQNHPNHAFVNVKDIPPFSKQIIQSTKAERFAMKNVPDTRADMIVVAMLLVDFILEKASIAEVIVSNFAMKEGILSELIH